MTVIKLFAMACILTACSTSPAERKADAVLFQLCLLASCSVNEKYDFEQEEQIDSSKTKTADAKQEARTDNSAEVIP